MLAARLTTHAPAMQLPLPIGGLYRRLHEEKNPSEAPPTINKRKYGFLTSLARCHIGAHLGEGVCERVISVGNQVRACIHLVFSYRFILSTH